MFCNNVNILTVNCDQLNASLLNKIINFLKYKLTDPKLLNGIYFHYLFLLFYIV